MTVVPNTKTESNRWTWGPALLVSVLLILAVLDLVYGIYAIRQLRAKRWSELVREVQQGQSQLISELLAVVDEAKQHTLYLSRHPDVQALVSGNRNKSSEIETRVSATLLPYLVSFPKIDGLRILNAEGQLSLAAFRQGQGVGVLPKERLHDLAVIGDDRFGGALSKWAVQLSPIEDDASRVEVPPDDRKYIYLRSAILDQFGDRSGSVILAVYAAPLLKTVRRFQPLLGSSSFICDRSGKRLETDAKNLAHLAPELIADSREQVVWHDDDELWILQRSKDLNGLTVVSYIPAEVLDRELSTLDGEFWIILVTMLIVVVLLSLVAVFFYRSMARDQRLRATENFLERIRLESAKYKSILEGAADMILMVKPVTGEILELNHAAIKELPDARIGGKVGDLVSSSQTDLLQKELTLASEEPGRVFGIANLHVRGQKNEEFSVEARLVAIDMDDGALVQVSWRDRSEEIEVERRFRMADRLGSLGLLTAGVAHEINNPLAAIGNYLSLLRKPDLKDEQRLRYAELIHHGFKRIGDIVRDLLRFARPSTATGEANLTEVLNRCLSLIEFSEDREGVTIDARGFDESRAVIGDAGSLEQVLLNLLLNALRAVEGRGSIRISVARNSDKEAGRELVDLVVEDDGPGIPGEYLERVFDPFFTMSGGTGLGLSVSYATMQAMGGSLLVENRAEGGARFTMRCAANLETAAEEPGEPNPC